MATRRLSGMTTSSSVPDNGGDHSGGGGSGFDGPYVDDVFSTYLVSMNGGPVTISNGIDLDGQGGMVWWKNRTLNNGNGHHRLSDTERGVNKSLTSSGNYAEASSPYDAVTSFNADGFVFENGQGGDHDYVSWTFRKAPKFFDVVTYVGSSEIQTIPHNLGVKPGMIIVKKTTEGSSWAVYHQSLGADKVLNLNESWAASDNITWASTEPTDKVFTVGVNGMTNTANAEFVAYLFAHDDSEEGMIQCGSFTSVATGSTTDVDLGWEPQWLLAKTSGSSGGWAMFDTQRGFVGTIGEKTAGLQANESNAEADYTNWAVNSRGFSYKETSGSRDFIYMAIRRPNKPAEDFEPEELFAMSERTSGSPSNISGFPVDFAWTRDISQSQDHYAGTRLTQGNYLTLNRSNSQNSSSQYAFDYQNGWLNATQSSNFRSWMFRRAPGFFDVVCWDGEAGLDHYVPHNLGVAPEIEISKVRNNSNPWGVLYAKDPANMIRGKLNSGDPFGETGQVPPTDTEFKPNEDGPGRTYVTYLFASVPGICDIGSYTGNGSAQYVDCGFTNGARFVLIKRTDAEGDWMFFDTLRGISGAESPMLTLNTDDAQVSGSFIQPNPLGFKARGTATNIDGAEYIYMAIA